MTPTGDRVFVVPDEKAKETKGGIVVPEARTWDPDVSGVVTHVGPGLRCRCGERRQAPVAVGDHVVFSWKAGQEVTLDGERHLVMRFDDVLAVLEA